MNRLSFLAPNLINPITGTPGALTFAGYGPQDCQCDRASQIPFKNFGPHVGFAYAATPKTVLRGSFNIAFTHDGGVGGRGGARQGASQLGFSSNNTVSSPDNYTPAIFLNSTNSALLPVTPPVQTPSYGTGYTTTPGFTAAGQGATYVDPYLSKRPPYYENFNFGFQREVYKQTTVSIDYSGSNGRFLPTGEGNGVNSDQLDPKWYPLGSLLNQKATPAIVAAAQAVVPSYKLPFPNFNPAYTIGQSLRPYPQYSGVSDIYGDFGMSSYNSLQVVATQRPAHGLSYTFNYTLSKLFDNTGSGRTAYDHSFERSLSLYDHPHNVSAYAVYKEPFGEGQSFVDKLIKGYEISGIYTFTSGTPLALTGTGCLTVFAGTCEPYINPAFTGNIRQNGNYGHGQTAAALASTPYINPNAFIVPAVLQFVPATPNTYTGQYAYVTVGNASRTAPFGLRGPGGYNVNMSFRRYFGLYERLKLLMEVDAFNVTNHTNFANPNVSLGNEIYSTVAKGAPPSSQVPTNSGSFGTVTGVSGSSRDLQIVARIEF